MASFVAMVLADIEAQCALSDEPVCDCDNTLTIETDEGDCLQLRADPESLARIANAIVERLREISAARPKRTRRSKKVAVEVMGEVPKVFREAMQNLNTEVANELPAVFREALQDDGG
jgi:hypothetical protein